MFNKARRIRQLERRVESLSYQIRGISYDIHVLINENTRLKEYLEVEEVHHPAKTTLQKKRDLL